MKNLIEKSTLYIVATPIGNLKDITLRALDVLQGVDCIAAEDTRQSGKLLKHYGVTTPAVALHEHNERQFAQHIIDKILSGESWALISDAGTPLISDPGYYLISQALSQGLHIVPVPGVSSVITALCASGLPTDRFAFEGFLPPKQQGRRKLFAELARETRTLIFFESPHRIKAALEDMEFVLGTERSVVFARELTKTFETIRSQPLGQLRKWLEQDPNQQKGEMVLLLPPEISSVQNRVIEQEGERVLRILLDQLPVKQAVSLAVDITGVKKNVLYQMALRFKSNSGV